jgi:phage shock protein A
MELFDRFERISKTDIDQILNQAANPEEVLERTIQEIEQTWLQTKQAIAKINSISNEKAQLNYNAATIETSKWRIEAQIAHNNKDEHSEKHALERLRIHEDNAIRAKAQMHQYTDRIKLLHQHSNILERKLIEAENKRDLYKAQIETAEAQKKSQDILGDLNFTNELDSLQKITIDTSQKPKDLLLIEKAIQNIDKILTSEISSQSQIRSVYYHAKLRASNLNKQASEAANRNNSMMTIQTLIEQTICQELVNIYQPKILEHTKRIELLEENLVLLEEVKDIVQEFAKFVNDKEHRPETYDLYDPAINAELDELRSQLENT